MFQSSKGQILNQNDIVVVEKKNGNKRSKYVIFFLLCLHVCSSYEIDITKGLAKEIKGIWEKYKITAEATKSIFECFCYDMQTTIIKIDRIFFHKVHLRDLLAFELQRNKFDLKV